MTDSNHAPFTERERLAAEAMEKVRAELGRTPISVDVFIKRVIHLTLDAAFADPTYVQAAQTRKELRKCLEWVRARARLDGDKP